MIVPSSTLLFRSLRTSFGEGSSQNGPFFSTFYQEGSKALDSSNRPTLAADTEATPNLTTRIPSKLQQLCRIRALGREKMSILAT
ncbi:hypothetical protein Bca52824_074860 [Brassica carinata]|uniref:Uncharacterized protein n=1 Tax=Brassica carinata TaxID=52824 RepID=A0A8X7PP95_BRACI|nr:hypothetical protein Bca52824_074860 [Brassica carinata]